MPPMNAPSKSQVRHLSRMEYVLQRYPHISTSKIHDLRKLDHFTYFVKFPCLINVFDFQADLLGIVYFAGEGKLVCSKGEFIVRSNTYHLMTYEHLTRLHITESRFTFASLSIVNANLFSEAIHAYIYKKMNLDICTQTIYNPVATTRDDGLLDVLYVSGIFC